MKVLAIGGSGGMGRFAVRTAEHFEAAESIVVADFNEASAVQFASSLGSKVSGMQLDVTDSESLTKALRGVDVVINTSGPFFKIGVPILKASIDSGCHYLDICDDWEPTVEMLKLDGAAKEAGISATIGLGASPGVTNLLGLLAMRELDVVETVYTGWNMSGAKPEEESSQTSVNAAMLHAIEQMTGKVKIYRNGDFQMTRPLKPVTVPYPGREAFIANIFGHPEAVTFPHHYPEIKESLNLAHGGDGDIRIVKLILTLVDWKLVSKTMAAKWFTWLESRAGGHRPKPSEPLSLPIYGLAIGTKDGKPASVGASFASNSNDEGDDIGMGAITGCLWLVGLSSFLMAKFKIQAFLRRNSAI